MRRTLEIANVQMLLPFHASRTAAIVVARARRRPATTTRVLRAAPPHAVFARTGRTTVIRALVEPEGVSLADAEAAQRQAASWHGRGGRAA